MCLLARSAVLYLVQHSYYALTSTSRWEDIPRAASMRRPLWNRIKARAWCGDQALSRAEALVACGHKTFRGYQPRSVGHSTFRALRAAELSTPPPPSDVGQPPRPSGPES